MLEENKKMFVDNYKYLVRYAALLSKSNCLVDAEDIVATTYIAISKQKEVIRHRSYIVQNIKFACMNRLSTDKRYLKALPYVQEIDIRVQEYTNIEDELNDWAVVEQLLSNIDKTNVRYKVLKMVLDGKSYEEISNILGLNYNTIKAHYRHCITFLKKGIEDGKININY